VDQPESFAKALSKHVAAGDCIDNPYKIDENEMSLLNVEIDVDRFVIDKPSAKLHGDNKNDGQFFRGDKGEIGHDDVNMVPGKLVVKLEPADSIGVEVIADKPLVKREPVGDNAVEDAEEDSYDHCLEMSHKRRIFDEEDDEDVVVV